MNSKKQSRKVQFTINNPEEKGYNAETIERKLASLNPDYYCFGLEIGEQGTPHYHGFFYRQSPIRFGTFQDTFPKAHIEFCIGSCRDNRDYVSKTGKWQNDKKSETVVEGTFKEWGEMPIPALESKDDYIILQTLIKDGYSNKEIIEMMPKYSLNLKRVDELRQELLIDKYKDEFRDLEVIYLYGNTGVGKTSSIYKEHKGRDICRVSNYNSINGIKFDAYRAQPVLVFEEFHSDIPINDMLNYLDIYPLMLPARYYDRVACYTKVYITSNIPLNQQYRQYQIHEKETWNAFKRRITKVYRMDENGILHDVTEEAKRS